MGHLVIFPTLNPSFSAADMSMAERWKAMLPVKFTGSL